MYVYVSIHDMYIFVLIHSFMFFPLCNYKFINTHANESNAGQGGLCLRGCTQ